MVNKIGSGFGQAMATGAANSAVTSAVGSALDVTSFSWKNVAISAAAAGVGYGASQLIGRAQYGAQGWDNVQNMSAAERTDLFRDDAFKTFGRNLGSGVAAGATSAAARGNFSSTALTQIGLDALGSSVGNAIADQAAARSIAGGGIPYPVIGQVEREHIDLEPLSLDVDEIAVNITPGLLSHHSDSREEVELNLWIELAAQDALDQGDSLAQLRPGARVSAMPPRGAIEISRRDGVAAALDIASDGLGLLEPIQGTRAAMAEMNDALAKQSIDDWRSRLGELGLKGIPKGYEMMYVDGGRQVIDYQSTMGKLGDVYSAHLRDLRLRETWGDDYADLRLGKSKMTVQEFEQKVFDVHQKAVDQAYDRAIAAVDSRELPIINGFARTVGSAIDERVRQDLRLFAKSEGINDDRTSKIWAINRRLQTEGVRGYGIPDSRLGRSQYLYMDTTLALKSWDTPQLQNWNRMQRGSTVVVRPTKLGGPYVVRPMTITRGGR